MFPVGCLTKGNPVATLRVMSRLVRFAAGITAACAAFVAAPSAQAPTPIAAAAKAADAAHTYTPPKTPWGHPDLQGSYTTADENGVPMERPDEAAAGK